MTKTIVVIGALDTKGNDFAFVKAAIEDAGHKALVIDTGVIGEPGLIPDIPASDVAEAAGVSLQELRQRADRGEAIASMTKGIAVIVEDLFQRGMVDGVLGMGGSAGTAIGTAGMRILPIGVPKVQVSTLAGTDVGPYVGTKDVVMFPSVVDV
ncbi:MAG TPA: Tm-1-like ATP-binding domain-containing protein, partial [candidate division Zixibacteria bacterium]|nr:Tm-1-like ATP-binding domain-containing protein [candidate division Zixibacteria bacterium]